MKSMSDPLFMVRMQAAIDAGFLYACGVALPEAIRQTVARMRLLFGEGVPRELVEVVVTVGYCARAVKALGAQSRLSKDR